jgi:hypothetical protein
MIMYVGNLAVCVCVCVVVLELQKISRTYTDESSVSDTEQSEGLSCNLIHWFKGERREQDKGMKRVKDR